MRKHRFIRDIDLDQKELTLVDDELVNQLRNVLRLKTNEIITLCDGKCSEAEAKIIDYGKNNVTMALGEKIKNDNTAKREVFLYASIIKKENFEIVCQKATEIGVSKIVPIISKRTVKTNLNMDRLKKIILEASEQSERPDVPELLKIIDFNDAIKNGDEIKIIFDKNGENIKSIIEKMDDSPVSIFIGPEGGWTENEVTLSKENGFIVASLGNTNLRAETASIISTHLLANF